MHLITICIYKPVASPEWYLWQSLTDATFCVRCSLMAIHYTAFTRTHKGTVKPQPHPQPPTPVLLQSHITRQPGPPIMRIWISFTWRETHFSTTKMWSLRPIVVELVQKELHIFYIFCFMFRCGCLWLGNVITRGIVPRVNSTVPLRQAGITNRCVLLQGLGSLTHLWAWSHKSA